MIQELIRDGFGIRSSEVSAGCLLGMPGLPPHKPLCRALQQDAEAVERWRQQEYLQIKTPARQKGIDDALPGPIGNAFTLLRWDKLGQGG